MSTSGNYGTAELRAEGTANLATYWNRSEGFSGVDGFILGENEWLPEEVGVAWIPGDRPGMALTVGGARKGKGASTLVPALLGYSGPCIALDVKGELAWITAERRRELGQRVVILDPFGEVNHSFGKLAGVTETTTKFNPLAVLDPSALSFADDISGVIEALIWQQGSADPFFVGSSRELMSGIIAAEIQQNPGYASLADARDWLNLDEDELAERCRQFCELPDMRDTFAARKLRPFSKVTKSYSAVIATCKEQLAFLDSEQMRQFLVTDEDDPFDFSLLSTEKITVYLVLSGIHLETHARFLRLCITQAIRHVIKNRPALTSPIAFFLDEMGTSLGPMPILERAWGLASGYGMVLWGFVQDLSQLKRDYPQSWETFVANSSMIQVIGCRDPFTSNFFSDYLGKATVETIQRSTSNSSSISLSRGSSESIGTSHGTSSSYSSQGGHSSGSNSGSSITHGSSTGQSTSISNSTSVSISEIGKPLLDPDQIRRMSDNRSLVIFPGQIPYQLIRLEYFSDCRFHSMYRPDPHYPPPALGGLRLPKQRNPSIIAEELRLAQAEAKRLAEEARRLAEAKEQAARALAAQKALKAARRKRLAIRALVVLSVLAAVGGVIFNSYWQDHLQYTERVASQQEYAINHVLPTDMRQAVANAEIDHGIKLEKIPYNFSFNPIRITNNSDGTITVVGAEKSWDHHMLGHGAEETQISPSIEWNSVTFSLRKNNGTWKADETESVPINVR